MDQPPVVHLSDFLSEFLEGQGFDPGLLASDFAEWKTGWPKHEYDSIHFGKDSAYATPAVGGRNNILKHVHLRPLLDPDEDDEWMSDFRYRRRKTSDRCLVYAERKAGAGPYLLIAILEEPDAHLIARMTTQAHKDVMNELADVADQFITFGLVDF